MKPSMFKTAVAFFCLLTLILWGTSAFGGFIDFENGVDRQAIASTIPGLEFTTTAGYDWIYGDWRTGSYNGPYPNGIYWSEGNFFAWLGEAQGAGVITFTESYATYFQIGYSSYSYFYLEAYDELGNLLDTDTASANTGTGELWYLRVDAPGMAYVMMHDTGNYWLVDNLETDAIQECTLNVHCDDGQYCNGEEQCIQWQCTDGEPVECEDDGLWCNGEEICDEDIDDCKHEMTAEERCPDDGEYCNGGEFCNDDNDECDSSGTPCPDDGTFCNGTESCDETADECKSSGNPCEDDGVFCNGTESCNETDDACESSGNPCPDDGAFCNGTESCDEAGGQCTSSGDPCPDDGAFCNGSESCDEGSDECAHSGDPCDEGVCNEETDQCDAEDDVHYDPPEDDSDEEEGEDPLWPGGKVSGGCSCS